MVVAQRSVEIMTEAIDFSTLCDTENTDSSVLYASEA